VEDLTLPINQDEVYPYKDVDCRMFRGQLKGLEKGKKRFFLLSAGPDGPMDRVSIQSVARECARIKKKERDGTSGPGGYGTPAAMDQDEKRYEDFIRFLAHKVVEPHSPFVPPTDADVWPSSGEEPGRLTPPPGSKIRRPKIIEHRVLRGPARVALERLRLPPPPEAEVRATLEDVEMIVSSESPSPTHQEEEEVEVEVVVYVDSSEERLARTRSGPSKPRKRARGRPRLDGTGPFRDPTPSIAQQVDMACDGELPPLRPEDVAPVSDRSRIRRGESLEIDHSDSEDAEPAQPHWRIRILELSSGSSRRIAAAALEALDKVDRARASSKNLQGRASYDLRIGSRFARQACLALCQAASRYGADLAVSQALEESQAKVIKMEQEINRLRTDLQLERNSRLYLLNKEKARSREPSPTSSIRRQGLKRTVQERRGVPSPQPPAVPAEEETGWRVIAQEVVMDVDGTVGRDEAEREKRSLSPMSRFAAADPQVTGVLADLVKSIKGLEERMAAIERGFRSTAPERTAPHPDHKEPPTIRKRKKRSKSTATAVVPGQALARRASAPVLKTHVGPSSG